MAEAEAATTAAAASAADATPTPSESSGRRPIPTTVQRGVHVILRDSENAQKVFWLGESCKDLRMGRYPPIPIENVLGMPYGAILRRSDGGQWNRFFRTAEDTASAAAAAEAAEVYESNQHLAQDNSAQAMSPGEVNEMKGRCGGEAVVEALASNSTTFATKTKFAQEKYLKKKQQKHVQQVILIRPSLQELCETYMKSGRNKVCGLRFDYLSSVLCHSDVRTGGRYLIIDSAASLVVAAMAQQMAGNGKVYRVYRGGCPEKALTELDLGSRRSIVRPMPIEVLQSTDPASLEWFKGPVLGPNENAEDAAAAGKLAGRKARVQGRKDDFDDLKAQGVNSLVIVTGDEESQLALEVLEVGLKHLRPGGRVVVYGQNLQPLAAKQGEFRTSGDFVEVRMHQLFTREYQVLPMRTHPVMTAEAMLVEGFILSATKVQGEAGEDVSAEAPGAKRRRR
mmetsp:Transcript_36439/g.77495  ORF Transcript_36439/g.77495 Transcript_36439/m.77495 type:complete len:453 (-) Transcript_36439:170-1528(-)